MNRLFKYLSALALIAAATSSPAYAGGTFSFALDNDLYFGNDREYSNGGLFTYTADVGQAPGFLEGLLEDKLGAEAFQIQYAFGQLIYTPDDKTTVTPLLDERPYVGLLYGELAATFEKNELVHRIAVQAGWFGPQALGREIQNLVHTVRGLPQVDGWDNQISFEPALNINYDVALPVKIAELGAMGFVADPFVGLSFGNISTSARAGVSLRIGPHLDGQPSVIGQRPGTNVPRLFRPEKRFRWNLHGSIVGQVEAYSSIIEGNLFRESLRAPERTLQWEARGGLLMTVGRYWLGASATYISRQHDFQPEYFHKLVSLQFGVSLF